jgi:uncharacterized membrane protein
MSNNKKICGICKCEKHDHDLTHIKLVPNKLFEFITEEYKELTKEDLICIEHLNEFREKFVNKIIHTETKKLGKLKEKISSMTEETFVASDVVSDYEELYKFGQKLADNISEFAGSWKYIITLVLYIIIWTVYNSGIMHDKGVDPYPYSFLNLALAVIVTLQGIFVMMSQNRQAEREKLKSEHAYKVDLKAELEIRILHEKIDHMITHQWQRFMELEQLHIQAIQDLTNKVDDLDDDDEDLEM